MSIESIGSEASALTTTLESFSERETPTNLEYVKEPTGNSTETFAKFCAEGALSQATRASQMPTVQSILEPEKFVKLSKLLSTPPSKERDGEVQDFLRNVIGECINSKGSSYKIFMALEELRICEKVFFMDQEKVGFVVLIDSMKVAVEPYEVVNVTKGFLTYLSTFSNISDWSVGVRGYSKFIFKSWEGIRLKSPALIERFAQAVQLMEKEHIKLILEIEGINAGRG